jgi:hypothetical protein
MSQGDWKDFFSRLPTMNFGTSGGTYSGNAGFRAFDNDAEAFSAGAFHLDRYRAWGTGGYASTFEGAKNDYFRYGGTDKSVRYLNPSVTVYGKIKNGQWQTRNVEYRGFGANGEPWSTTEIPGLYYKFGKNAKPGFEGGMDIRLGYIDKKGFSDLNWVQTVTTNKPLEGKKWQSRDGFDENSSRYYSYTNQEAGKNIYTFTNQAGFSVDFMDFPTGDISEGIWWNAEISLLGKKDGKYSTLFTVGYGFSYSAGGTDFSSYINIQQAPSLFHIIATSEPSSKPIQIPYRR